MNLYWVKTKDNYEDWFMVAPTKEIACKCHESFEGFNDGDATAMFICEIDPQIEIKYKTKLNSIDDGYWPSREFLIKLGFEFLENLSPCVVRGYGRLFCEGKSCLEISLQYLENRKGVYLINIRNTNKFKIGVSKRISKRIKEIKTLNPYSVDLWYFLESKQYLLIEKFLHKRFKTKRLSGEWFEIRTINEINSALLAVKEQYKIRIYDILKVIEKL